MKTGQVGYVVEYGSVREERGEGSNEHKEAISLIKEKEKQNCRYY